MTLLENALIAKQDQFTPENFSIICSVIQFDDAGLNSQAADMTLKLPIFLHENRERVLMWLADESFVLDMQDFVHVACAYISMFDKGSIPEDLLRSLEQTV